MHKIIAADRLLEGAIDLHIHGFPEISLSEATSRLDDFEVAASIQKSKMSGFLLKSHIWPTVNRVYNLKKDYPNLNILSSITLNTTVGGFNPISVECAAKQGAKFIFMPTWSARNDLERGGFCKYLKQYVENFDEKKLGNGISILDKNGEISTEVKDIIDIARSYRMKIATGHISVKESIILMDEINNNGKIKIIFNHPDSHSIGGTIEEMEIMAEKGAYIEFCCLGLMPTFQRISPSRMTQIIKKIGAEHCIISSDFFFDWAPPPPEMLRMVIGALLIEGVNEDEIRTMVQVNPVKIIEESK